MSLERAQELSIYRRLYEIGKSLNETIELEEIYELTTAFATGELGFEKCLIFEHDDKNGWFKVVKSAGYTLPHELQILKIINLLLSGEIIEYLRVKGEPLIHTQESPKEALEKLLKSLFLEEAYLELFGGDVEIPHGVIVVGNGAKKEKCYTNLGADEMVMLALGNFTTRLSSAVSNRLFYEAWSKEKENLQAAIKHQRELNYRLQKEQQFVSTLLNNTNAIIALINSDGVMERINSYGEEFVGFSQEQIAAEPFFWKAFLPLEVQGKVVSIVENVKAGKLIERNQNAWISKNGEERIFDWANAIIKNEKGEMEYLVTVGMDITNEIAQQHKLQEALIAAQNAARIKGEFLANMSHEIRTPMNGILGFIQLFAHTNLDEKQKKYIDIMHTSAKTLLGIINDILDVSKIESGKFELDIRVGNIMVVLEKIAMTFMTKIEEKKIDFRLDIDKSIAANLSFDQLRLEQIISNLLGNAIKFTPENGKIRLYLEKLEETKERQRMRIGIQDSGIGIAPEHQERIFEAFSQAAVSTTRKYGGTGLGLTISSRLAVLMDSKLQLQSQEGEGSEFYFDVTFTKV